MIVEAALSIMVVLALATPSYGTNSIEHAEAQLQAIVDDADQAMQAAVDKLITDSQTASTKEEVGVLETAAKVELGSIKASASDEIALIGESDKAYKKPSNTAHNAVNALHTEYVNKLHNADSTSGPVPITPTTVPVTPTTTTVPGPNTAVTPLEKETLGETSDQPTPKGTPSPTLTAQTSEPPWGGSTVSITLAPSIDNSFAAAPPQTAVVGTPNPMSNRLIAAIGVVIPPRIAAMVLSPLIVLEHLVVVLTASASSLIVPGLLLAAAMIVLSRTGQRQRESNA